MSLYAIATQPQEAPAPPATPGALAPSGAVATAEPAAAPAGTGAAGIPLGGTTVGSALKSIATYIPTELMATYLAILAIVPSNRGHLPEWVMFWIFLIATPFVVWLSLAVVHRGTSGSPAVKPFNQWPWWSMAAATIAFAAFVLALPGSVVNTLSWYDGWIGSVAIFLSAFILSQGERFFGVPAA